MLNEVNDLEFPYLILTILERSAMKYFRSFLLAGAVVITLLCIAPVQADELDSYLVINLPYAPKKVEPWYQIIRSQEEWQAFYAKTAYEYITPIKAVEAPIVDFKNYQLLVGGLGAKPTNGYSLVIEQVTDAVDGLSISVLDVSLTSGCVAGAVISYPYAAVLLKKTDKPLRFELSKAVKACHVV